MRNTKKYLFLFLSIFSFLFIFPKQVYAYIDPGAGSYVFQLILGFLFGGVVMVKLYWKKILSLVGKLLEKKPHEEDEK